MRTYAQNTVVPIARSRGEIDDLLRHWGALGIQWSDDYEHGVVALRFVWPHEGRRYMARFVLRLPGEAVLRDQAVDGRSGRPSQGKLDRLRRKRGQQEHRVLLLWLKAALNAVEAGLVSAEALFLPFLEGRDGRTVAEVAAGRLSELFSGAADRLLTDGVTP